MAAPLVRLLAGARDGAARGGGVPAGAGILPGVRGGGDESVESVESVELVELVELVDADGTVTGVVTRAEMRAGRLRHRCVAVVVRRTTDGAVLVHRRAEWKDVWPSYWDIAFGGVCGVGEDWVEAAVRELAEEAGIHVDRAELESTGAGTYTDADVDVVAQTYLVRHDGPFAFADGEVTEVGWVPVDEIRSWAATRDVCPDTMAIASALWLPPR